MSVSVQTLGANVLEVEIAGRLDKADYEALVPRVEQIIDARGKVRVLLRLVDFQGWDAGALWEDIKFNLQHFRDIERVAMIGEKAWEHGMANFCRPFTSAAIRWFEKDEADAARAWIIEGTAAEG